MCVMASKQGLPAPTARCVEKGDLDDGRGSPPSERRTPSNGETVPNRFSRDTVDGILGNAREAGWVQNARMPAAGELGRETHGQRASQETETMVGRQAEMLPLSLLCSVQNTV